jgi:NDP-mannose synthase
MQAIILAGGRGRRLMPYTTVLPKPLMPIGDCSILEVIIKQLAKRNFDDIIISTGYLHELLMAYLNSLEDIGVSIRFSHETHPLGTIAPLHLIRDLEETFLVMNGDILTDLDYLDLLEFHTRKKALATVATFKRDVHIDFGVLEHNPDRKICKFIEKPNYSFEVSMGVYVFQKEVLDFVPKDEPFGFDNLMYCLTEKEEAVFSFPHSGYWLDIGRPDDYTRSIEEFEKNKEKFLP